MGKIHDQLGQFGRQGALGFVDTARERRALEVAHEFMADENGGIGYIFSGWCQTALPHRRLPDDEVWAVRTDYVKLMVEPGSIDRNNQIVKVGVPFGSRARLILLYLQGEAIRSKSPEIELGRSLRVWLGKLGVPIGGRSLKEVREQCLRLSRCRMSFQIAHGDRTGFINQNIVDTAMFSSEKNGSLLETVCLSDRFFRELQKHPVPLQDAAIRSLSNNSQALDIYCWLAYRLHSLSKPTDITWSAFSRSLAAAGRTRRPSDDASRKTCAWPWQRIQMRRSGLLAGVFDCCSPGRLFRSGADRVKGRIT